MKSQRLFAAFLLFAALAAPAAAAESAASILQKVKTTVRSLDSFSYVNVEDDYQDEVVKARVLKSFTSAKGDAKKLGTVFGSEIDMAKEAKENVEYRAGKYLIQYVKPYLLQLQLLETDYIPKGADFVKGGYVLYRPDVKKNFVFLKFANSPMILGQNIRQNDLGFLFTQNWLYDVTEHDFLLRHSPGPKLIGEKEINGRAAYYVEIPLKYNPKAPAFTYSEKDSHITAEAKYYVDWGLEEMRERLEKHGAGIVRLWIDKKENVILKKEVLFNNKVFTRKESRDISLNSLTKANLLDPKKPAPAPGRKK